MTIQAEQASENMGAAIYTAAHPKNDARLMVLATDLISLTKPRITSMVVATMLGGMWVATRSNAGSKPLGNLILSLLGTVCIVAGANTLNMYMERDTDRLMDRTKTRPLPTRRLSPEVALWFGIALAIAAVPLLIVAANITTGLLAALAFLIYVLVYTPLKRRTTLALPIGAVPGAIPPLLGWTAVTETVGAAGLVLFSILFFWQIPHFLAIATFRREDYRRAGLKVLPNERGDRVTRIHIMGHIALLVVATLLVVPLQLVGGFYLPLAALLGAGFFLIGAYGFHPTADTRWARALFGFSILYLVLLLAALMLNV